MTLETIYVSIANMKEIFEVMYDKQHSTKDETLVTLYLHKMTGGGVD